MKYFFTLSVFIIVSVLHAQEIDSKFELLRFKKCYALFVRNFPQDSHPLVHKIVINELSAADACRDILSAVLETDTSIMVKNDSDSIAVFRTIMSFHRSWFAKFELNLATQDYSMADFYDVNEMAMHLSYNFFKKNLPFKSVLSGKETFEAIRKSVQEPVYLYDNALNLAKKRSGETQWDNGITDEWNPDFVSFGEYVGISKSFPRKNKVAKHDSNGAIVRDSHKSIGGGIIGTVPYVLLNSGQNQGKMDGLNKDHRSWAKAILNEFMCLEIPLITKEEAQAFVVKNSPIVFQNKAECMQCHATIDNMAAVIRNVEIFNTTEDGFVTIGVRSLVEHPIKSSSREYYNQSKSGVVVLNLGNEKIRKKISGIEDLSQWITSRPEFYQCTVKKVFSFITGNRIENINELEDKKMGEFLQKLSFDLMKEQRYFDLFSKIIDSEYF